MIKATLLIAAIAYSQAPELDGSRVVIPADSGHLEQEVRSIEAYLAGKKEVLAEVERLEAEARGSVEPLTPGMTRVIEMDANRIRESQFEANLAAAGLKSKVEFYDIGTREGNGLHIDLFKPEFDRKLGALLFSTSVARGGNPDLTTAFNGPLFAGSANGWGTAGGKSIRCFQRFRFCFDLSVSESIIDLLDIVEKTNARWLTFWQLKDTYSYHSGIVLGVLWDWSRKDRPCFMVIFQGDTRSEKPEGLLENRQIIRDIPILPDQRFEIDCRFDPTGETSLTVVKVNGETVLDSTEVNCTPKTNDPRWDWFDINKHGKIRGPYIGAYLGLRPRIVLERPIEVRYRNITIDHGEPVENVPTPAEGDGAQAAEIGLAIAA